MYKISPTIDTKVCNKKVAVDDSYTKEPTHRRGDVAREPTGGDIKSSTWSCVDYVDSVAHNVEGKAKRKLGAVPAGRGLSVRFGSASDAEDKAEDGHGTCNEQETSAWKGRPVKRCGEEGYSEMVLDDEGPQEKYTSNKWYTGKRTNHGWPGTAEGKINTAQGMAGDLVSNLNREEKNAVAGILSKTITSA